MRREPRRWGMVMQAWSSLPWPKATPSAGRRRRRATSSRATRRKASRSIAPVRRATRFTGNYHRLPMPTGTTAIPNAYAGAEITSQAGPGNLIGGAKPGMGNVISGNSSQGVALDNGATGNSVAGNLIGLNAAGTAAVPNMFAGSGDVSLRRRRIRLGERAGAAISSRETTITGSPSTAAARTATWSSANTYRPGLAPSARRRPMPTVG